MANLTNNRLNVVATAAQIASVKAALTTIDTNLPFLIGLTTEERILLPAINVDNKVFTEDAINAGVAQLRERFTSQGNTPSTLPKNPT